MESETGETKKGYGGILSLHLFVVLKFYIMSMIIVIIQ